MSSRSLLLRFALLAMVTTAFGCKNAEPVLTTSRNEAQTGIEKSFEEIDVGTFTTGWASGSIEFPDIGHPILDESVGACVQLRRAMEGVEAARLVGLIADGAFEARPLKESDRSRAVYQVLLTVHKTPAQAREFLGAIFLAKSSADFRECNSGMTRDTIQVTTSEFEAAAKPAENGKSLALRSISGNSDRITEIQIYGWTDKNLAVYVFVSAHADTIAQVNFQQTVDETYGAIGMGFD